ncbi:MAG: amidohydrolase [Desulfobacteraceae bacterium]|jgi:predicted amidohydrolase
MQDIAITLIQSELDWEDIPGNLSRFDAEIDAIEDVTDLIILPEMFSTGFSMKAAELAEPMDGRAVTWLKRKAVEKQTVITGSVMVREQNLFYNRLVWARPDGTISTYDKKHLFRSAGEEKIYTAGKHEFIATLKGWKIRPFICYDLRFPIWTRNLDNRYDLAIFVANWPAKRSPHWRTLLMARAIENQTYVAAVNRVGTDGKGFDYDGHSAVIDPTGKVLFEKEHVACTSTMVLSSKVLTQYRSQFPAWMDADKDMVTGP